MTEYTTIVSNEGLVDLEHRVNALLREGWHLQGGIAVVAWGSTRKTYYQALVRYADEV